MAPRDARRTVPSVDRVLRALVDRMEDDLPHPLLTDCARRAVDDARRAAQSGEPADEERVVSAACEEAEALLRSLLRPVVNATGVVVHTNLGRVPLDPESLGDAARLAGGYSNLEFDLDAGRRGSRHEHAGRLLARLAGAEAGIVVNNNAAAVLITLAALGRGREVVVSRGELVEIGGGFRIPDVMAESGARLVEVGTTNRTRRSDYAEAVGPDTALLLKVHASNYRVVGFTDSVPVRELTGLGPVMFDVGSGLLDETAPWIDGGPPPWLAGEPGVRQAVADGAAIVTFSGDKLLGGPQAGVVVGQRALVERVARHPLARAVRADKFTLAALQTVALAYLQGRADRLPLWRTVTAPTGGLRERAEALAGRVTRASADGTGVEVIDTQAVVGGGSLPGSTLPSVGVAVGGGGNGGGTSAETVAAALRSHGIVARIDEGRVVCDLRTVAPEDDDLLADAIAALLAGAGRPRPASAPGRSGQD